MTSTQTVPRQKATYVKVELLNIDGSTIGFARIRPDAEMRKALGVTLGPDYDQRIDLPVPAHADPRCPYSIRVTTER